MNHLLLDINILLDVLLNRMPWSVDSGAVWKAADAGRFQGYIAGTTVTTVFYVARRQLGTATALGAVDLCLQTFRVSPVTYEVLHQALRLPGPDFEDNVQIACAVGSGLDGIITRDPAGFRAAPLPVLTAVDALARLPR